MVIDQMLKGNRRRLRTNPERILMDASGYRLWADYLEVLPGFEGRIDFIHKINIPCLFRVECDALSAAYLCGVCNDPEEESCQRREAPVFGPGASR